MRSVCTFSPSAGPPLSLRGRREEGGGRTAKGEGGRRAAGSPGAIARLHARPAAAPIPRVPRSQPVVLVPLEVGGRHGHGLAAQQGGPAHGGAGARHVRDGRGVWGRRGRTVARSRRAWKPDPPRLEPRPIPLPAGNWGWPGGGSAPSSSHAHQPPPILRPATDERGFISPSPASCLPGPAHNRPPSSPIHLPLPGVRPRPSRPIMSWNHAHNHALNGVDPTLWCQATPHPLKPRPHLNPAPCCLWPGHAPFWKPRPHPYFQQSSLPGLGHAPS